MLMKAKFRIPGNRKGDIVQVQAMRCRQFDLTRPSDAPKMTLQSLHSCSDPPSACPPKQLPQQPLKHLIQRMLVRCSVRDQTCICSACLFPCASALRARQLHSPSMQEALRHAASSFAWSAGEVPSEMPAEQPALLRSAQLWVCPQ